MSGDFEKIATGELSLSVVGKLKPFLTNENVLDLAEAVSGKSVREAERILATRFPKPDVADSIRKLPDARYGNSSTTPAVVTATSAAKTPGALPITKAVTSETLASVFSENASSNAEVKRPADRGKMQPLSEDRIQVKFTASRALEEKLELARDLTSHRNPRGDLATIVEAGVDLLLAELLKKKLGQTKRRQKKARPAKRTHVTMQTRREVAERDGLGCTFLNASGERCGARAFLELDHRDPKGKGADSEPDNVRLLCAAHNQLEAERAYGRPFMERKRKRDFPVRDGALASRAFVVGLEHPRRRGSQERADLPDDALPRSGRGVSGGALFVAAR
jgi:hypothetical protein